MSFTIKGRLLTGTSAFVIAAALHSAGLDAHTADQLDPAEAVTEDAIESGLKQVLSNLSHQQAAEMPGVMEDIARLELSPQSSAAAAETIIKLLRQSVGSALTESEATDLSRQVVNVYSGRYVQVAAAHVAADETVDLIASPTVVSDGQPEQLAQSASILSRLQDQCGGGPLEGVENLPDELVTMLLQLGADDNAGEVLVKCAEEIWMASEGEGGDPLNPSLALRLLRAVYDATTILGETGVMPLDEYLGTRGSVRGIGDEHQREIIERDPDRPNDLKDPYNPFSLLK